MVPSIFWGVQDGNRVITVYALSRGEYLRGRPVMNLGVTHGQIFAFFAIK